MNPPHQGALDRLAALTEIWRSVLGNPGLDGDSDLFENHGSSLHVLEIAAQMYDVLGVDVSLRDVFSHPSPWSLSAFLDGGVGREGLTASGSNP